MSENVLLDQLNLLETQVPFLSMKFYNNPITNWIAALLTTLLTILILNIVKVVLANRVRHFAEKTETDVDDFVAELLGDTRLFLLSAIGLSAGSAILAFPQWMNNVFRLLPILAFLIQIGIWGHRTTAFMLNRYVKSRTTEDEQLATRTMISPIKFIMLFFMWAVLVIVALDNMGMDITALVTGLGVGGVAVALAVQNVLGDLLAALSIVIDKPFVIGDFIIIDNLMGTVEHIGLKTTRVRSLSGEQLVFSNSDLLKSRIRNYKRMYERRVVFTFGLLYQTKLPELKQIPGMVQRIIESQERTRFDRAHFAKYGESSLDFEAVYYVTAPDYNTYMDIQQEINFELFRQFGEKGIEFAYPTRTLFIANNDNNEMIEPKNNGAHNRSRSEQPVRDLN